MIFAVGSLKQNFQDDYSNMATLKMTAADSTKPTGFKTFKTVLSELDDADMQNLLKFLPNFMKVK